MLHSYLKVVTKKAEVWKEDEKVFNGKISTRMKEGKGRSRNKICAINHVRDIYTHTYNSDSTRRIDIKFNKNLKWMFESFRFINYAINYFNEMLSMHVRLNVRKVHVQREIDIFVSVD